MCAFGVIKDVVGSREAYKDLGPAKELIRVKEKEMRAGPSLCRRLRAEPT